MRHILNRQGYKVLCEKLGVSEQEAEALVEALLKGFKAEAQPHIHHMVGVPGSGKTTYVKQMHLTNTVVLCCDDTMDMLPGYQRDKAALGNKEAFLKWEVLARELTYESLFRAVDQGLNIVMDFNGAGISHIDMLKYLKEDEGYKVSVSVMLIEEDIALERIKTRDRYVPPEYIPNRKKIIEELLPAYRAVADKYEEIKVTSKANTNKPRKPPKGPNLS